MKLKNLLNVLLLIALVAGTIYILRRHSEATLRSNAGPIFGTSYHISYVYDKDLEPEIRRELARVDASLSMFNDTSTVSRINSGLSTQTDPLFRAVFKLSQKVNAETDGAFDVTVAPLVNAWGFGFKSGEMPTDAQIDSIRTLVGSHLISLEKEQIVKKQPGVMLDFSSVAKGYGVDRVAALLRNCGIDDFMIEIGGEMIVHGQHPEGRPWRVGISKPTDSLATEDLQTRLTLRNAAMATSGNYRRFYVRDGRRYAHTIDPKTGQPVQHELLSATVFAPDCATADAYATAFMVLGLEGAKRVLAKHTELSAYLIYTDEEGNYATWQSPAVAKMIQP